MLLHRLPVRVALLGFTVFSVVATSAPAPWRESASSTTESFELAKGTPIERTIHVTASQDASVSVYVDSASVGAHFTITGCGTPLELVHIAEGWYIPGATMPAKTEGFQGPHCDVAKDGSTKITFTNDVDASASISWHVDASIQGADEDEDEPDDAHVEVSVTP